LTLAQPVQLSIALLNQGQWGALREGRVTPERITLNQIDVNPPPTIYRRMVRGLEFDVAEVAITTFLCARSFGIPITALPVFSNRDVTMSLITVKADSPIREPSELNGKRIGMRSYTVTNTTQARALLQYEFGVDTDRVRWVVTEDAHVAQYKQPANVEFAPPGRSLEEMLRAGEIDAAIQLGATGPDLRLLLTDEDSDEVGARYYRRTGVYPIGHVIVLKDETLAAHPEIAADLFRVFSESKQLYLDELDRVAKPSARDKQSLRNRELVGGDPLPFGLDSNRRSMDAMIRWNLDQHVIATPLDHDSLFAPGVGSSR